MKKIRNFISESFRSYFKNVYDIKHFEQGNIYVPTVNGFYIRVTAFNTLDLNSNFKFGYYSKNIEESEKMIERFKNENEIKGKKNYPILFV